MNDLKKTFKIPIYSHYRIHIVISEDIPKACKTYLKNFECDVENAGGLFIYDNKSPWQGWIFVTPDTSTSTIAHEAFHATYRIMSDIGSELGGESEEPYAYLIGHITNMVVMTLLDYEKKYPEEPKTEEIIKDN